MDVGLQRYEGGNWFSVAQEMIMEWIKCSDNKPGYPREVLVAFKSDADGEPCLDTGIAILFPDGKWRGAGVFYVMNGERKYQYRECIREVTHWAPLPEPPTE